MTKLYILTEPEQNSAYIGELLVTVNDRYGREKHWHELRLYRLKNGIYILQENYVARWEGELRVSSVTIYDDERAVINALEEHSSSNLAQKLLEQAVQTDVSFFVAFAFSGFGCS